MGHCPYDQLGDIEDLLSEIRGWPLIREPKPGIFYLKREPFLHFHEKDGRRWADIKTRDRFVSHELPFSPSKKAASALLAAAKRSYRSMAER